MIKISLKDGSVKEYDKPMSAYDIAKDISEGLARAACVAEIDGEVFDYSFQTKSPALCARSFQVCEEARRASEEEKDKNPLEELQRLKREYRRSARI